MMDASHALMVFECSHEFNDQFTNLCYTKKRGRIGFRAVFKYGLTLLVLNNAHYVFATGETFTNGHGIVESTTLRTVIFIDRIRP